MPETRYHARNARTPRTQRHANRDLPRAHGHRKRHHGIDSRQRQQQTRCGKTRHQIRVEASRRLHIGHRFLHRLDLIERQKRIDLRHCRPQHLRHLLRLERRPQRNESSRRLDQIVLRTRPEEHRRLFRRDVPLIRRRLVAWAQRRVCHDAHDRGPGQPLMRIPDVQALAHRVLARPAMLRHRLVHDHHQRRIRPIRCGEVPALQQRNTHGAKIVAIR